MRHTFNLILVIGILMIASLGCAHMGDPCDNDLVKRVPSPDGSHVVSIYNRQCSSALFTSVALEKPPGFLGRRGEVVCYLVEWGGKHPTEVEWTDSQNIFISTPDELTDLELNYPSKDFCSNIRIRYSIPGYPRPEPPLPKNESVPDRIRFVLSELRPCLDKFPGSMDPSKSIVHDIEKTLETGPESLAVDLIIRFSDYGKCEMTDETFEHLVHLAKVFNRKPPNRGAVERDSLKMLP